MSYTIMYVVFGFMFLLGGAAYWYVTKSFRDEKFTYEPLTEENK